MKTVIVEDSRLARVELLELLKAHPKIQVVAQAENCEQALALIAQHNPELLLLDINLPDGSGFDILEQLEQVPEVIFTTAYDEFAIQAFEVNALDYLMKPIRPQKLARALDKLDDQNTAESEQQNSRLNEESKIFVKDGDRCWLIEVGRIRYFENCGNHAQIFFDDQKPFVYKSLAKIEQRLNPATFIRVNRQHIVNLNYIQDIQPWNSGLVLTMTDGKEIEVSRRHASNLKNMLSL